MKHLFATPVSAVILMFGAVMGGLLIWIAYEPDIQSFLYAAWEITCGFTW